MDATEALKAIKEAGLDRGDPATFWYIYGIAVTSILLLLIGLIIVLIKGFLAKFLSDIKETNAKFALSIEKLTISNENLTMSNASLTTMMRLHDHQIKHLEEDVKDLSKRRSNR